MSDEDGLHDVNLRDAEVTQWLDQDFCRGAEKVLEWAKGLTEQELHAWNREAYEALKELQRRPRHMVMDDERVPLERLCRLASALLEAHEVIRLGLVLARKHEPRAVSTAMEALASGTAWVRPHVVVYMLGETHAHPSPVAAGLARALQLAYEQSSEARPWLRLQEELTQLRIENARLRAEKESKT